jgi:hypothetical protein
MKIKRGLEIAEGFLMEILGTVIEIKIFKNRYNDMSILAYEIVYKMRIYEKSKGIST